MREGITRDMPVYSLGFAVFAQLLIVFSSYLGWM